MCDKGQGYSPRSKFATVTYSKTLSHSFWEKYLIDFDNLWSMALYQWYLELRRRWVMCNKGQCQSPRSKFAKYTYSKTLSHSFFLEKYSIDFDNYWSMTLYQRYLELRWRWFLWDKGQGHSPMSKFAIYTYSKTLSHSFWEKYSIDFDDYWSMPSYQQYL